MVIVYILSPYVLWRFTTHHDIQQHVLIFWEPRSTKPVYSTPEFKIYILLFLRENLLLMRREPGLQIYIVHITYYHTSLEVRATHFVNLYSICQHTNRSTSIKKIESKIFNLESFVLRKNVSSQYINIVPNK